MARTKSEEKKNDSLESTLETLEKKYGLGKVNLNDATIVSTGSIQLDQAMHIGGTPLGKMIEIFGEESSGKAQPLSSKILTPTGWITMKDVEIGTIVSTPDGGDSTVIGIFPQGEQDVYKITFDDKSSTHCTLDHLWQINTRGTELGEVLSTKQLIEKGLKTKHGTRNFKIPTATPVAFEQFGKITINPYLLGILLGDGGFTDTNLKFTTIDDDILNEVTKILNDEYEDVTLSKKFGIGSYNFRKKKRAGSKPEILLQLIDLGLHGKYSYEKHIPQEYLLTSVENRFALFQGLMDSDGSVESGTLSYSSTSIQLSKDIEFLARSLGYRCTTSSRVTKYTSATGKKVDGRVSYRMTMLPNSMTMNPFRLQRKANKYRLSPKNYSDRYIESIELVGKETCQCIMIGHPDQLYITDNFIVTHNTTLSLHQMAEYQKAFPDRKVVLMDFENSFDPRYAKAIGVDVDKLLIYQPESQEQGYDMVLDLISNDIVSCVVIDSQTAAAPKAIIDSEMTDATIAIQARNNSKFCLKVRGLLSIHKTTLFFISQTRNNIGGMGDPNTTTGGKAIKFYSDIRWKVWKMNDKEKELNKTTVDIIKSKVSKPFGQAKFPIKWGIGISTFDEILEYAIELKIIKRAGSWYSYGDTKLGQGSEAVVTLFNDNPEFYKEIKEKVLSTLRGDSTTLTASESPVDEWIDASTVTLDEEV